MKALKIMLLMLVAVIGIDFVSQDAEARRKNRSKSTSSRYNFGSARPATGVGSNLHRRFVLKQESQRAQRGLPVRNRNNILWYR